MNRGEILPTPDIGVYALHYAKLAAIARRTIARQADGKAWRGMDIQRPPYKDEVQYADDLLHGRRKSDVVIIVGSAIVGGVLGVAIALAGSSASDEAPDPMFILSCIGIVAFAFAVITGLMLASLRTIAAICKAWIPARVIVGIVCVLELFNILQSVTIWLWDPSRILMDVTLDLLGLAFGILFLLLGLRVIFWIYCTITGKDDEAITAREIAANDRKKRF